MEPDDVPRVRGDIEIVPASYQGDTVSLSQFRGKNVLLLFPRGRYENQWCRYCHYQYTELVELEMFSASTSNSLPGMRSTSA